MSGKKIGLLVGVAFLLMLLCGGGGAAFWYFKYGPGAGAADVGPLPGRALVLPADTAVVGGFDAKAFFASSTFKQISSGEVQGLPPEEAEKTKKDLREGVEKGLKEGEDKVGIRLDKDVDRMVLALWNVGAQKPDGALLAFGRFDRAKIVKAVGATAKAEGETLTASTVAGIEVQTLSKNGQPDGAFAFLDDATIVAGSPAGVEKVVSNHGARQRPLEGNTALLGLIKGLDAASGYWLVLDSAVTARAEKEAAGNAPPGMVPRTLTLAGKFEGALQLAAQMPDEGAAKNLADMIQGGLGMAKMQIAQNPEAQKVPGIQQLLDGIQVKAEGPKVTLTVPPGGPGLAGALAALAIPSYTRSRAMAEGAAAPDVPETTDAPQTTDVAPEATPEATPEPVTPAATPRPAARPTSRPVARATPRVTPPTSAPAREEIEEDEETEAPPARPTGPVRVGGNIAEPRKLKNVSPNYPAIAKQARVQGIVILECTISAQGRVSDVRVLRSIPLLDQAATDAVRQWVYEPTLVNGVPTPVIMTVTVNFKLN